MRKGIKGKAWLAALAGAGVLALTTPLPAQQSGAEIWGRECGRCHRTQPPRKYDAETWHAVVAHMGLQARLTTAEEEAVREFLMSAARKLSMETPQTPPAQVASNDPNFVASGVSTGEEIFDKQCVACHGSKGKGDGPASVAFNPKPANLTDAKLIGQLTDDELLQVISGGKKAMPAFEKLLSPEELKEVTRYVRSLSQTGK